MGRDTSPSDGTGSCMVAESPASSNPLLADILPSLQGGEVSSVFRSVPAPSATSLQTSAISSTVSSLATPRLQPLSPQRPAPAAPGASGCTTLPKNRNFLQRLRRLDPETQLPSVRPFNHIILSLDFFEDIRDEVFYNQGKESPVPSGSPTRDTSPRSSSTPESSATADRSSLSSKGPIVAESSSFSSPSKFPAAGLHSASTTVITTTDLAHSSARDTDSVASDVQMSEYDSSRSSASISSSINCTEKFSKQQKALNHAVERKTALVDRGEACLPEESNADVEQSASTPSQECVSSSKNEKAGETVKTEGVSAIVGLEADKANRLTRDTTTHSADEDDESDDEYSTRKLQPVPTNFTSVEHYVDVFFPLFLQEAKQAIQRAKKLEMGVSEIYSQIPMDTHVSEWWKDAFFLQTHIKQEEDEGDILLTLERLGTSLEEKESSTATATVYTYNDLVLLSHPSIPLHMISTDQQRDLQQKTVQHQLDNIQEQTPPLHISEGLNKEEISVAVSRANTDIPADANAPDTAVQHQVYTLGIVQRAGIRSISQGEGQTLSSSSSSAVTALSSSGIVVRIINPEQLWKEKTASWRGQEVQRQQQRQRHKQRERERDTREEEGDVRVKKVATTGASSAMFKTHHTTTGKIDMFHAEEEREKEDEEGGEEEEEGGGDNLLQDQRRKLLLKERERKRDKLEAVVHYLCKEDTPTWTVRRIMNLTSLHREYQALMSIPDLHLINELLCSKNSSSEEYNISSNSSSKMAGLSFAVSAKVKDGKTIESTGTAVVFEEKQHEKAHDNKKDSVKDLPSSSSLSSSFSCHQQPPQQKTEKSASSSSFSSSSCGSVSTAVSEVEEKRNKCLQVDEDYDDVKIQLKKKEDDAARDGERRKRKDISETPVTTEEKEEKKNNTCSSSLSLQERESFQREAKDYSTSHDARETLSTETHPTEKRSSSERSRLSERGETHHLPSQQQESEVSTVTGTADKQDLLKEKLDISFQELMRKEEKDIADEKYFSIPPLLLASLQNMCNYSQIQALQACLKYKGITLIQGPPGTGKTTTILALLSVLLNAQVRTSKNIGKSSGKEDLAQTEPENIKNIVGSERISGKEKPEKELQETTATADVMYNSTTCGNHIPFRKQQYLWQQLLKAQPWLSVENYTPWEDLLECSFEDLSLPPSLTSATEERVLFDKAKTSVVPNRVLVCAPSNAAIDEIVKRLVLSPLRGGGVLNAKGQRCRPSVVRVGPNVRPDLVKFSLEYLAQQQLSHAGTSLQTATLADIKLKILEKSQVVCGTLSACGSRDISRCTFDTVVIDEASQGVEVSTLIPLRLGCRRLILVGDPRQLPATIFSRVAIQHRYDQSLFERLEAAGQHVNLLSTQYRMHPVISEFASRTFYQNQLQDAEEIHKIVKPPLPWYNIPIFKPLVFFSLNTAHQEKNASFINVGEAGFVCQLLDLISQLYIGLGQQQHWASRVAVISPYGEQVFFLRREIKKLFGGGANSIDINTVDGFQGQEKDLIIFCAVRAEEMGASRAAACTKTTVGFLADERRINVALTRARTNLWVVGNGRFLMSNHHWRCLWRYTKELGTLISIDEKYLQTEHLLKKWLLKFLTQNPGYAACYSVCADNGLTVLLDVPLLRRPYISVVFFEAQKAVFQDRLPTFLRDIAEQVKKSAAAHGKNFPVANA